MSTMCDHQVSQNVYAGAMQQRPIDTLLAHAARKGWKDKELALEMGITGSVLSNWKKRGMPASEHLKAARVMGVSVEELVGRRPPATIALSVAHDLSQLAPIFTPITLSWGDLMNELPEAFQLVLHDDAMAPDFKSGGTGRFTTKRQPKPGSRVLLADRDDNVFFREYRHKRGSHWQAWATNPGYQPLDSEADGLRVLAVMTGWDWPDA